MYFARVLCKADRRSPLRTAGAHGRFSSHAMRVAQQRSLTLDSTLAGNPARRSLSSSITPLCGFRFTLRTFLAVKDVAFGDPQENELKCSDVGEGL
jgi:hypothetical protein